MSGLLTCINNVVILYYNVQFETFTVLNVMCIRDNTIRDSVECDVY